MRERRPGPHIPIQTEFQGHKHEHCKQKLLFCGQTLDSGWKSKLKAGHQGSGGVRPTPFRLALPEAPVPGPQGPVSVFPWLGTGHPTAALSTPPGRRASMELVAKAVFDTRTRATSKARDNKRRKEYHDHGQKQSPEEPNDRHKSGCPVALVRWALVGRWKIFKTQW